MASKPKTQIFLTLLDKFKEQVIKGQASVTKAKEWFRKQASKIANISGNEVLGSVPDSLLGNKIKDSSNQRIAKLDIQHTGRMIMYFYDPLPLSKKRMFAYDTFPLVIPIKFYPNGFMGLNLHYLPLTLRAKLLSSITDGIYKDKHLNEKRKLKITYDMLNSTAKHRWFKPCVLRYLYKNVKSRFLLVDPNEWEMMLMLPTERFEKATKEEVWNKSRISIGLKPVKGKRRK